MPFDKNGHWKPNRKQEQFLALPTSIREAFYGGGAGSGKSEILLVYPLIRKWHENPRFKQVFMRRTYPELKNEIVPRSQEFYPKFGAKFNKSEMVWTFPRPDQFGSGTNELNGARIFLGHCENEDDVSKYDSMEINLYTPDELTSFTEYIYMYVGFTRVRTSDPNLPAIIRAAGMPGGIGHKFVNDRFVKPWKEGGKIIVGKGGNKRIFIFSTQADNPHVDPNYKQSLEGLPEAEKKAKLYGDFDAYQGQVFSEFRDRRYPDEPENALHVIPEFVIPAWWPKVVVIDWGFAAYTWVGFGAISPKKRVYLYRELKWREVKIEDWGVEVKRFVEKENPVTIRVCKSAGQDRGQEHTIQQQIEAALGRPVELTTNTPGSRIAGKMLLHEYLRWKPKPLPEKEQVIYDEDLAQQILRVRGLDAYKAYLAQFIPLQPEDNLPKLLIFEGNDFVVDAIKSCSYDKPKNNKPAEDVAAFDGDDAYDGVRYLVDFADQYFAQAEAEFKKVQRQQDLIDKLSNTQNWTAYYRGMEKLEGENKIKPVPRYARRH